MFLYFFVTATNCREYSKAGQSRDINNRENFSGNFRKYFKKRYGYNLFLEDTKYTKILTVQYRYALGKKVTADVFYSRFILPT